MTGPKISSRTMRMSSVALGEHGGLDEVALGQGALGDPFARR
jgi:hypothetical protein